MRGMAKNIAKFLGGGLALVAIGVGALYLVQFYKYRSSPEYRAEQYFKDLERRYAEDPYGGSTPEETLQLFVDALKKGDVELASKYFVVDKQEEQLKYLSELKSGDKVGILVSELSFPFTKRPLGADDSHYIFDIYNHKDNTHIQFDVAIGPNSKWKIVDL